jgi:hypothetical protein
MAILVRLALEVLVQIAGRHTVATLAGEAARLLLDPAVRETLAKWAAAAEHAAATASASSEPPPAAPPSDGDAPGDPPHGTQLQPAPGPDGGVMIPTDPDPPPDFGG